jgi:hypothetical protein
VPFLVYYLFTHLCSVTLLEKRFAQMPDPPLWE